MTVVQLSYNQYGPAAGQVQAVVDIKPANPHQSHRLFQTAADTSAPSLPARWQRPRALYDDHIGVAAGQGRFPCIAGPAGGTGSSDTESHSQLRGHLPSSWGSAGRSQDQVRSVDQPRGIDLLGLPVGTRLTIGRTVITVTGLRNPREQINNFLQGLLKQVVHTDNDGHVVRLAGVMGIVSRGGQVSSGVRIEVELPPRPHHPLTRV